MAYFLCAQATGLQGVHLPIRDATKLLDSQYANETTLYVQDDDIMLERVWLALDTFCYTQAQKSIGISQFVFSRIQVPLHNGGVPLGFKWIPRGQTF